MIETHFEKNISLYTYSATKKKVCSLKLKLNLKFITTEDFLN